MSHEPEIFISEDRSVLQAFASPETLATFWNAGNDPAFSEVFKHIRAFNQSADALEEGLAPVSAYSEAMIRGEIDPIIDGMGVRLRGYDPLHSWIIDDDSLITKEETLPHRDHPCIGIFFYYNEVAGLGTGCVPHEHTGEATFDRSYPDADLSKAIMSPARGVGLIKLGELTHFGPLQIPEGDCRIVQHARYDI